MTTARGGPSINGCACSQRLAVGRGRGVCQSLPAAFSRATLQPIHPDDDGQQPAHDRHRHHEDEPGTPDRRSLVAGKRPSMDRAVQDGGEPEVLFLAAELLGDLGGVALIPVALVRIVCLDAVKLGLVVRLSCGAPRRRPEQFRKFAGEPDGGGGHAMALDVFIFQVQPAEVIRRQVLGPIAGGDVLGLEADVVHAPEESRRVVGAQLQLLGVAAVHQDLADALPRGRAAHQQHARRFAGRLLLEHPVPQPDHLADEGFHSNDDLAIAVVEHPCAS